MIIINPNDKLKIDIKLGNAISVTTITADEILTKLKTVDGVGSGLDADMLDGMNAVSTNTTNTMIVEVHLKQIH